MAPHTTLDRVRADRQAQRDGERPNLKKETLKDLDAGTSAAKIAGGAAESGNSGCCNRAGTIQHGEHT